MKEIKIIGLMLIAVLLTACRSYDEEPPGEKELPVINVYVYSPDRPIVTRSDVGPVDPIDNTTNESEIKKLQIWVFNHDATDGMAAGELVAYYSPESVTNLNGNTNGVTYQLSVSEAFAQQPDPKPAVDVYVLANVTAENCGLTLDEKTTRAALEAAIMQKKDETHDYFGLTNPIKLVPADGLPMSGVQRGAIVSGSSPVYSLPTVTLTRTVSKVRFIFSREKPTGDDEDIDKPISIKNIKLGASIQNGDVVVERVIPTQEYLFLAPANENDPPLPYHINDVYNNAAAEFLPDVLSDIEKSENPLKYVYQSQTAQDYENLIAEGISKIVDGNEVKELTQVGPFYLRESNKKLKGLITYQRAGADAKTLPFEMETAGDFSRNHTWTVYVYYSVSGLVAVKVTVKDWTDSPKDHEVYNW